MELEPSQYRELIRRWFATQAERLARLHRFVSEVAVGYPHHATETPANVALVTSGIEKLADNLLEKCVKFEADPAPYAKPLLYYGQARDITKQFSNLHRRLESLPPDWPPLELSVFLEDILAEQRVSSFFEPPPGIRTRGQRLNWTIVPSSRYNFSHAVVSGGPLYEEELEQPAVLEKDDYGLLFRVPKAELNNPFFWPVLVHEAAHALSRLLGIEKEAAKLAICAAKADDKAKFIARDWLAEITADLLATDILGPAYVMAFMQFSTFWSPISLKVPVPMHPPVTTRMNYMLTRLESKNGLQLTDFPELLTQTDQEFDARLQLDFGDPTERHSLFDAVEVAIKAGNLYPSDSEVAEAAKAVPGLASYNKLEVPSLTKARLTRFRELASELRKGIPISSRRIEARTQADTQSKAPDNYEQATQRLREIVNSTLDIANASMLRILDYAPSGGVTTSARHHHDAILDEFTSDSHKTVQARLKAVVDYVGALDALISKSLETTRVVKFYRGLP